MPYSTFEDTRRALRQGDTTCEQVTRSYLDAIAERLAARGFTVVAPDLYSGRFIDKMPVRHDPALEDDAALAIDRTAHAVPLHPVAPRAITPHRVARPRRVQWTPYSPSPGRLTPSRFLWSHRLVSL